MNKIDMTPRDSPNFFCGFLKSHILRGNVVLVVLVGGVYKPPGFCPQGPRMAVQHGTLNGSEVPGFVRHKVASHQSHCI